MSEALWQHVNEFWAQDAALRPTTEDIVRHMGLNYVSWLATQFSASLGYISAPQMNEPEFTTLNGGTNEPDELSPLPWTHPPLPRVFTPSPPSTESTLVEYDGTLNPKTMSDEEIMNTLRQIVSNTSPTPIYSRIKPLGQGCVRSLVFHKC
jgi:hypothetical protein